jgi:hypothetical protein
MASRAVWVVMVVGLLCLTARAEDEGLRLTASAHGSLSGLGNFSGAALDLALGVSLPLHPQALLGLEAGVVVPLRTGKDLGEEGLTLQALPALCWRFGSPETFGYVRLGMGVAGQFHEGEMQAAWVATGAAGFAVAPTELLFYFGFELAGELEILGPRTRQVGLGGFLGFHL